MQSLFRHVAGLVCTGWLLAALKSGVSDSELQGRCRSLLRRMPYWARGHLFLGTSALATGDLRTAYAAAQALTVLSPTVPSSWILLARCRIAAHQFDAAVELAQKALSLDATSDEAHEELAAALIPLERYEEASVALRAIPVSARTQSALSMISYLEYRTSLSATPGGAPTAESR